MKGCQRVSAGWKKNQLPVSDRSGTCIPFELGHQVIFLNSEAEGAISSRHVKFAAKILGHLFLSTSSPYESDHFLGTYFWPRGCQFGAQLLLLLSKPIMLSSSTIRVLAKVAQQVKFALVQASPTLIPSTTVRLFEALTPPMSSQGICLCVYTL